MSQIRTTIQKVEMAENGLILEVFVPYPTPPTIPEGVELSKATEVQKAEYHHRMIAALDGLRGIERIRTGPAYLEQEEITRADVMKHNEESAWDDYQESRAGEVQEAGDQEPAEAHEEEY